jgi:glycosyltransferase involved in cell wall biosynthesis
MITGKDVHHEKLARLSVKSFVEQTHPNKKLLIINDGEYSLSDLNCDEVVEIRVDNSDGKLKLGGLRNVAFDYMQEGDIWVQWDDDDWRHPNLLETQYKYLIDNNVNACYLFKQIRYFFALNHAKIFHRQPKKSGLGIWGTIMCRFNGNRGLYPNKSRGEDNNILYRRTKKNVVFAPAYYYVRFIHNHNTWKMHHFTGGNLNFGKININKWKVDRANSAYLAYVLSLYGVDGDIENDKS